MQASLPLLRRCLAQRSPPAITQRCLRTLVVDHKIGLIFGFITLIYCLIGNAALMPLNLPSPLLLVLVAFSLWIETRFHHLLQHYPTGILQKISHC
jgi:hypothetical protein